MEMIMTSGDQVPTMPAASALSQPTVRTPGAPAKQPGSHGMFARKLSAALERESVPDAKASKTPDQTGPESEAGSVAEIIAAALPAGLVASLPAASPTMPCGPLQQQVVNSMVAGNPIVNPDDAARKIVDPPSAEPVQSTAPFMPSPEGAARGLRENEGRQTPAPSVAALPSAVHSGTDAGTAAKELPPTARAVPVFGLPPAAEAAAAAEKTQGRPVQGLPGSSGPKHAAQTVPAGTDSPRNAAQAFQQSVVSVKVIPPSAQNPSFSRPVKPGVAVDPAKPQDLPEGAESQDQQGILADMAPQDAVPSLDGEDGTPEKLAGKDAKGQAADVSDKADPSIPATMSSDPALRPGDPVPAPSSLEAPPRQDPHEVARQVMDGMKAFTDRQHGSQVIITLRPEHLGEVTVRINVDGDRVTAAFHAASSEVRAILESSLPQLRQEMTQQGWKFDSDGVFGNSQAFLANDQQRQAQGWEQQPQIPFRPQRHPEYDGSVPFSGGGHRQILSSAAVDYRI